VGPLVNSDPFPPETFEPLPTTTEEPLRPSATPATPAVSGTEAAPRPSQTDRRPAPSATHPAPAPKATSGPDTRNDPPISSGAPASGPSGDNNPEAGGFGSDPDGCFKRREASDLLKRCAAKPDAWTGYDDVHDGSPNKASNALGAAIKDNTADTNGDRWTVNYLEKSSKDNPTQKPRLKCTRFFSKVGLGRHTSLSRDKIRSKFSGRGGAKLEPSGQRGSLFY
jgi:hypothetical protein